MRRALGTVAVLGALALTAFGVGRFWLLSSLPPPGGREPVAGLGDSVTVLLDSLAVPHVLAASDVDVYAALGYVHARDRLFQMELLRHAALGRLSELFGARTLETDRDLRALEMGAIARARAAGMSAESRAAAEVYARGVNAWIARDSRPLELRILGHAPEPWEPEHSLAIGVLQAWDLHFGGDELDLAEVAARLGPERARELIPSFPDSLPIIVTAGWRGRVPRPASPVPAGSNSWVIAGSRTASGKPILANDPHLVLRAPSLWYLAGLHAPGLDVVGVSIPGVPAIVLGHTARVAWGFTNAMVDDADYVLEELSPDSSRYRTTDGWAPVEVVAETIRVRGAEPVVYTRRRTIHGPIVDVDPRPDSVHAVV
ncbi:MAG TPA: penicillin acylase family protein, partial [Gemmatimonadales bacterium]|nr:penicillin acylase family protein [Gemmatimonadales bacterium]